MAGSSLPRGARALGILLSINRRDLRRIVSYTHCGFIAAKVFVRPTDSAIILRDASVLESQPDADNAGADDAGMHAPRRIGDPWLSALRKRRGVSCLFSR